MYIISYEIWVSEIFVILPYGINLVGNYGGYYDNLEKRAYEDGYDKDAGLSFIDWSARTREDVISLCPSELWGAE